MQAHSSHYGELYVDAKGILRMVMEEKPNGLVRGIDVSNMTIDGIIITSDLESIFSGQYWGDKRHRVIWVAE